MTDKDLSGLSNDPLERFIGIIYYVSTIITSTGYGDILAISMRSRLLISSYMIFIFSIIALHFFEIRAKS